MNKRRREANEIDFPRPGLSGRAVKREMIKIYICMRAAAYFASSPIALSLSPSAGDGAKRKARKRKRAARRERSNFCPLSTALCRRRIGDEYKKIPANLRLVYAIVSAEKYGPAVMPGERRFVVVVLREAETETKAAAGANFALYPLGKSSSVCARVIY